MNANFRGWFLKVSFVAAFACICAGVAVVFQGCDEKIITTGNTSETFPKKISVEMAAEKRKSGAYILDVRESCEWRQFHVPEAVWIPLGQLDKRLDEIPRDKEIVVVCRSGPRSYIGLEIIRKAGIQHSSSMAGGLNAWQEAGYPVETEQKGESQ